MTPEHLQTLIEALTEIETQRKRLDAVAAELQRAYSEQSGAWRYTAEGDAASEEIGAIETAVSGLEEATTELREQVFLRPDFAPFVRNRPAPSPLPDKLPDREALMREPRRPGAPPYPFLRPFGDVDDDLDDDPAA